MRRAAYRSVIFPEVFPRLKQFGPFTLDTLNECVWMADTRIALPPKPFAVLRYLVEHPGRLVSHDELLDALWPETYVQPQVLRTYMLDLRRVLEDDARSPRYIRSIPKRGYCFIASVTDAAEQCASPTVVPQHSPASRTNLAGRDGELGLLHARLEQARAGARQVVFITGEAGIGKTALIEALREQIESTSSAIVALGQCIPGFAGKQEYYPLADALRSVCHAAPDEAVCHVLCINSAGALSSNGADPAAPVPGEVCASVESIARNAPLVLILEDVQWADESTLSVLSALARRRGTEKLMIVATVAPQNGAASEAISHLIRDLSMRRLCLEIALPRISRAAVTALISRHLDQSELPAGLHEFVYQHSEGNPRFALGIVEHLKAEELLARDGSGEHWKLRRALVEADAATPGELARMIDLEIGHLPQHQQQLLEAASIAPVAFPAWLVAAALEQDLAATEDACDELARRVSIVKRAGEEELPDGTRSAFYVFTHSLHREVLYQRQTPARRSVRHRRVATRLRNLFRGREELIARDAASHYEAAGDRPEAIVMLRLAARRAIAIKAYSEAAELHEWIARLSAELAPHERRTAADTGDERTWPCEFGSAANSTSRSAKA